MRMKWYKDTVISILSQNLGVINKEIKYPVGEVSILFISQLTDRNMLVSNIIRPLMRFCSNTQSPLTATLAINTLISVDVIKQEQDKSKIQEYLLDGMTVVLLSTDNSYLVANIKKFESKNIEDPKLTFGLRSPKDSFTENLDKNISLIRYRIKDANLRFQEIRVGVRTKSRVAVIYIEDIVNMNYVNDIINKLNSISVDGVIESGVVQSFLQNDRLNLFPQMGIVERSDMACERLLEGKVFVLVEGSSIGLIAPKTLFEFLMSCDDNYDNILFGAFNKTIRFVSFLLSLLLTPFYVAVTAFHYDILPAEYILTLAISRVSVPFNAVAEAFLVEFILEILREALIRVPGQIGQAIGIVGAIIIGQAAVSAGVFSPLILIIGSMSILTSFVVPDFTISNPIRILKFIILFSTAIMGFYGFVISICVITVKIISLDSFGVPYLAPFAPFNLGDFVQSLVNNKTIINTRHNFLRNKDNKRSDTSK